MKARDLLDAAAKAAGMPTGGWALDESKGMRLQDERGDFLRFWNPLTDDADAFRLAVELGIFGDTGMTFQFMEAVDCESTRGAVVRAAADIGKNLLGDERHA